MGLKTLTEDFRSLGLEGTAIEDSLTNMLGEESEEAASVEGYDDGEESDVLDILEVAYKKKRKLRGAEATKARIKRRSPAGRQAAKQSAIAAARPAAKTRRKKRDKKLGKLPPKRGYVRTEDVMSARDALIENLVNLAEAVEHDPVSRFDEFVEAFNHLADLGEIMTIRYYQLGEEDLAMESIDLAINATEVLDYMEELGGALDLDEDSELEEALSQGMQEAEEYMSDFGEFMESVEDDDDDDDDDDLDEEFDLSDAAERILEAAKGRKYKAAGKKKMRKKGKGHKMKKKTGQKLTPFEKKIKRAPKWNKSKKRGVWGKGKERKDIKDPKALAGWLAHYQSHNRSQG